MVDAAAWHLARFNAARALAPLDHPRLADDSGNATGIQPYEDPEMIINLPVRESVDARLTAGAQKGAT